MQSSRPTFIHHPHHDKSKGSSQMRYRYKPRWLDDCINMWPENYQPNWIDHMINFIRVGVMLASIWIAIRAIIGE